MRDLGVGLVYWSALAPLFDSGGGHSSVAVLELEPQTLWEKLGGPKGWHYAANERLLDRVVSLPQAKLLHGVGHPLGGSVDDPIEHLPLLRRFVERLDPPWVSEHLSFNRIRRRGGHVEDTGFLLPPRQSSTAALTAYGVHRQLEALHQLWSLRPPRRVTPCQHHHVAAGACARPPTAQDIASAQAWEAALTGALHSRTDDAPEPFGWLRCDPGLHVLRQLIGDARRAGLVRALRYTMTSLLAGLGALEAHALFDAYFTEHAPEPFPAVEAQRFARFLQARPATVARVPYLAETLAFEAALVSAALFGATSEIEWSADPTSIFAALDAGKLPRELPRVPSRMRIAG